MIVNFRSVNDVVSAVQAGLLSKEEARIILDIEKLTVNKFADGTIAANFDSKEVTTDNTVIPEEAK